MSRDGLLLAAARLTDRPSLRWVHVPPRLVYSCVLPPLIRATFRWVGGRARLVARHSVVEGARFNVFLSDLDLSAYLPPMSEAEERVEAARLRAHAARWKRLLPSLGELEIHRAGERSEYDALRAEMEPLFSVLHKLRKVGWMETAHAQAPSEYHRYKALRSIQRILDELAPGARALPRGNYAALGDAAASAVRAYVGGERIEARASATDFAVSSYYLGGVEVGPRAREGLALEPGPALALLALFPGPAPSDPGMAGALADLRREHPRLAEARRKLSRIEWLMFSAYVRAQPECEEWMDGWLNSLIVDR